jgi:uncharacterized membrane protein YuzA (DUF378 family)
MLPATLRASPVFYAMLAIVVIGALNWLLIAAFKFDLVVFLTRGDQPKTEYKTAARTVYIAVGAVAVALVGMVIARTFA